MSILAIDIGGTFIKYANMSLDMDIIAKGKVKTPQTGREALIDAIENLYQAADGVEGIAVSMPGIIDMEQGHCIMGGALRYNDGFPIQNSIQERCPVPVSIENDAKCAAMAEAVSGSLQDVQDGFVLLFGTMIGGGYIKNRQLQRGIHFSAGEVSYMVTDRDGVPSFEGVWGNRCCTPSLYRMYAQKKGIAYEEVRGEDVFAEIAKGERLAVECLNRHTREIAVQIFNLQTVLDVERFAIGGGISAQPAFTEYIQKNLQKLYDICPYYVPQAEIVTCKYQNDANLYGALHCYLAKYHTV